jgi:hypothetical protein
MLGKAGALLVAYFKEFSLLDIIHFEPGKVTMLLKILRQLEGQGESVRAAIGEKELLVLRGGKGVNSLITVRSPLGRRSPARGGSGDRQPARAGLGERPPL